MFMLQRNGEGGEDDDNIEDDAPESDDEEEEGGEDDALTQWCYKHMMNLDWFVIDMAQSKSAEAEMDALKDEYHQRVAALERKE
ncbi:hypothetical protein E2562_005177 [Oryza meyeriana var. granulata]|uniref:Uncharacterized protein n=1 Tax=Oryza meyeriana var. granulata TaxID=110450 RepID=A0A6G1BT98_9ORYZ|nr:hypothetical protein E2562_005177 [Oryza meyeriana var. granulata]